mgnify:CR=1 FL=1
MALQYSDITGDAIQTLIAKNIVLNDTTGQYDRIFNSSLISSISICNNHAADFVSVDLYVYDATLGTFWILNGAVIPSGVTLSLDSKDAAFDNDSYEMRIRLNAVSSTVSVIIK